MGSMTATILTRPFRKLQDRKQQTQKRFQLESFDLVDPMQLLHIGQGDKDEIYLGNNASIVWLHCSACMQEKWRLLHARYISCHSRRSTL